MTYLNSGQVSVVRFCAPLLVSFAAILTSLACSDQHPDTRESDSSSPRIAPLIPATPGASALPLAGRYFGVARTEHRDNAEIVKLDADGSGALYSDQRWTKICQWKTDGGGHVSFQTAKNYGMFYAFSGTATDDTVRGNLGFMEGPSTVRSQMDVTFYPLDTADATTRLLGVPAGLYSDVHFVEEAGDMVGTEIFIGTVRGALKVAVAFVEGSRSNLFVPHEISVSADTLRFRTGVPGGQGQDFTAVFALRAVELWPADLKGGTAGLEVEQLPRMYSTTAFFQQEAEGKCEDSPGTP